MTVKAAIPTIVPDPASKLRPAERVRHHLTTLAAQVTSEGEHRLPATQRLADKLQVSPRTVATVYKELAHEGVLRTRVGDGTYLISRRSRPVRQEFRIGLSVSLPLGGTANRRWASEICGGVLETAGAKSRSVAVVPLQQQQDSEPDELTERTLALLPKVDGLILFPLPTGRAIREAYDQAGKPVVSLNSPGCTATADFVSPDYYDASMRLGAAMRETGRRRVLYLISGPIEQSISTQQRLAGLTAGIGADLGRQMTVRLAQADGPAEASGYAAVKAELESGDVAPDVVYAAGDALAVGAIRALTEAGLRVPDDTSVVGGTGNRSSEMSELKLTCCQQPLHELGEALLDMLIERLRRPGLSAAGRYLPMPFVGGGTTRDEEGLHLGIQRA